MNQQDLIPSFEIGKADLDFPVEPARSDQSTVQDIFAIGGSHNDNIVICSEAIHFHQKLVQSALSFIIRTHFILSFFAYCVQLVYKYYCGGLLFSLLE